MKKEGEEEEEVDCRRNRVDIEGGRMARVYEKWPGDNTFHFGGRVIGYLVLHSSLSPSSPYSPIPCTSLPSTLSHSYTLLSIFLSPSFHLSSCFPTNTIIFLSPHSFSSLFSGGQIKGCFTVYLWCWLSLVHSSSHLCMSAYRYPTLSLLFLIYFSSLFSSPTCYLI